MSATNMTTACEQVLDLMILNRNPIGEVMRGNLPKWIREELGHASTSTMVPDALALLITEEVVNLDFRYTDAGVVAFYTIDDNAVQATDFESIQRHKGSDRLREIRFALSAGKGVYQEVATAHNHLVRSQNAATSRERNVRRQLRASNYSESAVVEASRRFIAALDEVKLAEARLSDAKKARDAIEAVLS